MVIDTGSSRGARVKTWFPLVQDADGWPPAGGENLWAEPVSGDLYQIDNVPFFAPGVARGDIVRAAEDDNGELQITEIVDSWLHKRSMGGDGA